MSSFRQQHYKDGKRIAPIITNVCNFTPPTGNIPALLSIDEAETLFHEMGHALHGMFANTKYRSTSGTSVSRDFVELPSQIMEN
jgi:peptidyl-dipeptidase Dcp